ncbi:hypothetical protein [Bradyrhizobium sp. SRS-191]|uniref:hypothetical protein n=1 Tax=Bradyrhizobium sp. SRS-191 TaxID=2962606 RepID=UPI00211EC107|nr:hypothetical protein [Bradyrhizobium sp. SRS-191]
MTTTIDKITNQSAAPVAYVGKKGGTPTGWASWAFAPNAPDQGFGWDVTGNFKDQALLTSAGEWWVWDNNWTIFFQNVQTGQQVAVPVSGSGILHIQVTVDAAGMVSGSQLKSETADAQLARAS